MQSVKASTSVSTGQRLSEMEATYRLRRFFERRNYLSEHARLTVSVQSIVGATESFLSNINVLTLLCEVARARLPCDCKEFPALPLFREFPQRLAHSLAPEQVDAVSLLRRKPPAELGRHTHASSYYRRRRATHQRQPEK